MRTRPAVWPRLGCQPFLCRTGTSLAKSCSPRLTRGQYVPGGSRSSTPVDRDARSGFRRSPASGLWLRRSIRGERPVLPHSLLAEGHLGSVCLGDRVRLIHYRHAPDPGAWWPLALRPDSMPEQPLNVLECRPPTRQLDLLDLPARHADRPAHRVRNSGDHPSRVLHRQAEARSAPILVPDAQYDDALGPVPGDVESPGRRAVIAEPGFGDSRTWPGDGHESQCARDYAVLSNGGRPLRFLNRRGWPTEPLTGEHWC